jgi:hypothetical protein
MPQCRVKMMMHKPSGESGDATNNFLSCDVVGLTRLGKVAIGNRRPGSLHDTRDCKRIGRVMLRWLSSCVERSDVWLSWRLWASTFSLIRRLWKVPKIGRWDLQHSGYAVIGTKLQMTAAAIWNCLLSSRDYRIVRYRPIMPDFRCESPIDLST